MIITLQTLAKFYYSEGKIVECQAIAEAAHYLPLDLASNDDKYKRVSDILSAKQSAGIK